MGRIQANTGLVTGIDIQGTVEKLIGLQARPRELATARLKTLTDRQTAVGELTASVIAIQLAAKNLGKAALFSQTTVTSSNSGLLAAALSKAGSPTPGSYQFTSVRLAQAQHVLSQGFASKTAALGEGSLTLRDGGSLSTPQALSTLNGGEGVERGKIRVTDRSGATAVIDLRNARTIDDVLAAINSNESISVTASTNGDRLQLTDNSGESVANLRVQEVSTGTTASDLGLATINVAADSATGNDIVRLYEGLALSALNDRGGVNFSAALADLQVTFRDGSGPLAIDFDRPAQPVSQAEATLNATNANADLNFTAVQTGASFDDVTIQFVDGAGVQGSETVVYDEQAKTLTFTIAAGATTATDILDTLAGTPSVNAVFTSASASGSNGSGVVSLSDTATTSGGAAVPAGSAQSLGDVLETLNAADPTRLQAQLSASGDRIEIIDLTSGGGNFSVASLNGGTTAEDLGLTGSATSSTISGQRLLGGLSSPLLQSLNGGRGLGTLGTIELTDRSGASVTVDLSNAETVDDVLSSINNAGLGIRAELNQARNGIRLRDTTGATTSNLIIADGDANDAATKLGIAVDAAVVEKQSGDLHRQVVSRQTSLEKFNHGQGVRLGSLRITDSSGESSAVNLSTLGAETIGDVIDAINNLSLDVEARINDTGDGIALVDTAGGSGKLKVEEVGTGNTAADLKLLGESTTTTINAQPAEVIDGSTTVKITLDADDTLEDLVTKINATSAGLTASIFNNGSSTPYQLSLLNSKTGVQNAWVIDGSDLGVNLGEITQAQDALVSVGPTGSASLLVSSPTNVIDDAIAGIKVTLNGTSPDAVTVSVQEDVAGIAGKVKSFVDQYNKLIEKLEKFDFFQAESGQKGVLYGSSETLRIKSDLSRLLSGRFTGSGSIQSLAALGVGFTQEGELSFDQAKFSGAYEANAAEVEQFFTEASNGFAKKVDETVDRLAGIDGSVLINRTIALQAQVEQTAERINAMSIQLDKSKERMLMQFYRLETTIGKLQNTFGAIQSSLSNAVNLSRNV